MNKISIGTPRILVIEEDARHLSRIRQLIEHEAPPEFELIGVAASVKEGLALQEALAADILFLSIPVQEYAELEAFRIIQDTFPETPVVVLVESNQEDLARDAVQNGAQEYLVKETLDSFLLNRAGKQAFERARHQAAFAKERAYLGTLLDNIPDRIYFKDEQSRFIRINRALKDLFGLKRPEDVYGKTDADFYGYHHSLNTYDDEQRVMLTGEPLVDKIEHETHQSGRRSFSLTTKIPLRDRRGKIVGTCGISRDVTALKEMERALETERNLLRILIDQLPDHIFLKDTEGRYVLDNAAHQRWLGANSSAEIEGKTSFDFFNREQALRHQEADRSVLLSGEPQINHEEQTIDENGKSQWALITKVPWRADDGGLLGLVCLKRNVTEQKEAELLLKQTNAELASSRAELLNAMAQLKKAHKELHETQLQLIEAEKMKAIGRVAAGVAHEVKNPLAIIKMGLEFIGQLESADDSFSGVLEEMQHAVHRADCVILGLLDFSRSNELETTSEDLNLMLENALSLVRGEVKGAIEFVRHMDPDLPRLALDRDKISQVLINLLTNAIHAMEGGGILSVRTYSEQLTGVGCNIAGEKSETFRIGQTIAVLEIDDSGHGIPEEKLGKIFEPFFTTKPTGKGTGLGLSVVKTIIDLHQGTIDIRNLPGKGVRATLMFSVKN